MKDLQYFSSDQIPRWRSGLPPFNGQRPKTRKLIAFFFSRHAF
jgi:hypothetical protein